MGKGEVPAREPENRRTTFESFYSRYYGWVFTFFQKRGFPEEASREFTQDIFMRVYMHGMHEEPHERLVPWVITVAKNMAVSEFRKSEVRWRVEGEFPDAGAIRSRLPGPEEAVAASEEVQAMREKILQMPEMMRKCLILRYYHDMSPEGAAEYLSLSVNTVKTHLKRALENLRQGLKISPSPEGVG